MFIFLFFSLYYGPRYLVKVGLSDFGDFLVILLIQAKVNAMNGYRRYPKRLPKGSVRKIQLFMRAFPLLSEHQSAILAHFIDDSDVEGFLCTHFGSDYQKIIDKYEPIFRWMLPRLLRLGLKVSPHYRGRYACSCAKWVVSKMIFWIVSESLPNATQVLAGKTLSPTSKRIGFMLSIFQDNCRNLFMQLYLQTIIEYERSRDPKCFEIAQQEYDRMISSNNQDYQAWVELSNRFQENLGFSFPIHPKQWTPMLISLIMGAFDSYQSMYQFMSEITAN
jgi:hypothetical protein